MTANISAFMFMFTFIALVVLGFAIPLVSRLIDQVVDFLHSPNIKDKNED